MVALPLEIKRKAEVASKDASDVTASTVKGAMRGARERQTSVIQGFGRRATVDRVVAEEEGRRPREDLRVRAKGRVDDSADPPSTPIAALPIVCSVPPKTESLLRATKALPLPVAVASILPPELLTVFPPIYTSAKDPAPADAWIVPPELLMKWADRIRKASPLLVADAAIVLLLTIVLAITRPEAKLLLAIVFSPPKSSACHRR